MAKFLVFLLLIATVVAVLSAPVEEEKVQQALEKHVRLPRSTCDTLSKAGVGDAACAVYCVTQQRKGGSCENGACKCHD